MNKKICVLMLVCMFLLVAVQGISAVEMESSDDVSNDKVINPEPSAGGTATVWGYVYNDYDELMVDQDVGIATWPNSKHYGAVTKTNNEGKYEFTDVPAGLKVGPLDMRHQWFRVVSGYEGDDWDERYIGEVFLRVPAPGKYRVDIHIRYDPSWPPRDVTESSNPIKDTQDLYSNPQQFESVFSGSQSL